MITQIQTTLFKIKLEEYGLIQEIINLPSFNRIMIIYDTTQSSKECKEYIDTRLFIINDSPINAYYFDVN